MLNAVLIALVILLVAAVGTLAWSLRQGHRRLKEARSLLAALRSGDHDARALPQGRSAYDSLLRDLNDFADGYARSSRGHARDIEILSGVIERMGEGFVVADENERVIMANQVFGKMFAGSDDALGKTPWELVRNREFVELVRKGRGDHLDRTTEFEAVEQGKHYRVRAFYLEQLKGWAYVFSDITSARLLETVKADFITNLTHELRTPLTAVKGYLEAVMDPSTTEKDRMRFLEIVAGSTDRLTKIVADLLTLSDVERPNRPIEVTECDLTELVRETCALFEQQARVKGVRLRAEVEPLVTLRTDRFMVQQLLVNLLSNAIRFTDSGSVQVRTRRQVDGARIEVQDSGIGIPEAEVSRIFERFYTVDRTRSHAQGGTGLGLAIVKHIVQALRGTIEVQSQPGKGSTFTVWLPSL